MNSQELKPVDSAKLLGVTINNTLALQWSCHVLYVIQKANKRTYFLMLLKSANVPATTQYHLFVSYLYKASSRLLGPPVPSRTS